MKLKTWTSLVGAALLLVLWRNDATRATQSGAPCPVVRQALGDSLKIKQGMLRSEVEQDFEKDGGMQFASPTRYVYKKCPLLHLDVEFDLKNVPGQLFSPNDAVKKSSKLYVQYQARD